jgi:hypothetical protein
MASEKRPASDDLGGGQMVVKRPNLGNNSKALATTNGSAANGALIQSVCTAYSISGSLLNVVKESLADGVGIGTANEWTAGSCYGTYRSFGRGLLCEI